MNDVPRGTKQKIQLPSQIRKAAEPTAAAPEKRAGDDEIKIRELAHEWARLHSKANTRDQMDALLVGLPEPMQRKVYLCGQRIAAGLSPKIAT